MNQLMNSNISVLFFCFFRALQERMASRALLALLEPEAQLVQWACRDQKASRSVTRFIINRCNILDLILKTTFNLKNLFSPAGGRWEDWGGWQHRAPGSKGELFKL